MNEQIKPTELKVKSWEAEDPFNGEYRIQTIDVRKMEDGTFTEKPVGLPEIKQCRSRYDFDDIMADITNFNEAQLKALQENQQNRYLMKVIRN